MVLIVWGHLHVWNKHLACCLQQMSSNNFTKGRKCRVSTQQKKRKEKKTTKTLQSSWYLKTGHKESSHILSITAVLDNCKETSKGDMRAKVIWGFFIEMMVLDEQPFTNSADKGFCWLIYNLEPQFGFVRNFSDLCLPANVITTHTHACTYQWKSGHNLYNLFVDIWCLPCFIMIKYAMHNFILQQLLVHI